MSKILFIFYAVLFVSNAYSGLTQSRLLVDTPNVKTDDKAVSFVFEKFNLPLDPPFQISREEKENIFLIEELIDNSLYQKRTDGKKPFLTIKDKDIYLSAIKPSTFKKLLTLLKGIDLPYYYINDGCFLRAQVISIILEQYGINTAKIVLALDKIVAKNIKGKKIKWSYHIDPLIAVDLGHGNYQLYVIDLSVASRPLTIVEWLNHFKFDSNSTQLMIYNSSCYKPTERFSKEELEESYSEVCGISEYSYISKEQKMLKKMGIKKSDLLYR